MAGLVTGDRVQLVGPPGAIGRSEGETAFGPAPRDVRAHRLGRRLGTYTYTAFTQFMNAAGTGPYTALYQSFEADTS